MHQTVNSCDDNHHQNSTNVTVWCFPVVPEYTRSILFVSAPFHITCKYGESMAHCLFACARTWHHNLIVSVCTLPACYTGALFSSFRTSPTRYSDPVTKTCNIIEGKHYISTSRSCHHYLTNNAIIYCHLSAKDRMEKMKSVSLSSWQEQTGQASSQS